MQAQTHWAHYTTCHKQNMIHCSTCINIIEITITRAVCKMQICLWHCVCVCVVIAATCLLVFQGETNLDKTPAQSKYKNATLVNCQGDTWVKYNDTAKLKSSLMAAKSWKCRTQMSLIIGCLLQKRTWHGAQILFHPKGQILCCILKSTYG